MPEGFSMYKNVYNNWTSTHNILNHDFELYGSARDAEDNLSTHTHTHTTLSHSQHSS